MSKQDMISNYRLAEKCYLAESSRWWTQAQRYAERGDDRVVDAELLAKTAQDKAYAVSKQRLLLELKDE